MRHSHQFLLLYSEPDCALCRPPAGGADGGAGGAAGGGTQSQVRGGEQPTPPLHCLDQTGGQARLYSVR